MRDSIPVSHWTVAETFARCPEVIPVFHRMGMACIGCVMAPFETLAEAAEAYDLDVGKLLSEFHEATAPAGRGSKGIRSGRSEKGQ